MTNVKNENLELKKLTLTAWARMLCNKGLIDLNRCNRMIVMIEKMKS